MVERSYGRATDEIRPVTIELGYQRWAEGSVLLGMGETRVLVSATYVEKVPRWLIGKGRGWVTAEYSMLPRATLERTDREVQKGRPSGRTQEIQRLIGRSLRAVTDLKKMGEVMITVDCDVLQADGGTRTASITGAYVALSDAVRVALRKKWIRRSPVRDAVAAVSVGRVGGRLLLDLDYKEDVAAEVDMNVVMTGSGRYVEVQGTGEEATFTRADLDRLVGLASRGIKQLLTMQERALRRRLAP